MIFSNWLRILGIHASLILLINLSVSALDCEYLETEQFTKLESVLYVNGERVDNALEKRNFKRDLVHQGHYGNPNRYKDSFEVYSLIDFVVDVEVRYLFAGSTNNKVFQLEPFSYGQISEGPYQNTGGIDFDSVEFFYLDGNGSEGVMEEFTYEEEVCSECPSGSGFICRNLGSSCTMDIECGSNICALNGVCSENPYVIEDEICSSELEENCMNSPLDCTCGDHTTCAGGICVADENNPPSGMGYCIDEFRSIKSKDYNLPCDCSFECQEHLTCKQNKCVPDCSNPPSGQGCCEELFVGIKAEQLGDICKCDFQCGEGLCYQESCQRLTDARLKCPSGTNVKKGETLNCNIYASNVKLSNDLRVTFELESGSGLAFSSSEGCEKIEGSQCIGTYEVYELSNEGINVELNALAIGDSQITGNVVFEYEGKKIEEEILADFNKVHVFSCGDGKIDYEETKENCCEDVSCPKNGFVHSFECNKETHSCNKKLQIWMYLLFLTVILLIIRNLTKLVSLKHKSKTGA